VAFGANTTQTGQEIVVKGNFTFDMASLTFDNCTIYMSEDANVSLATAGNSSTKQLYIKGSTVQGCKTLWRGIKVFPTTQLYVEPNAQGKASIVRDAEKAFDVQRSTSAATTFLKLDGAVFEKNMYALFVNDNTCSGCSLLDINPSSVFKGNIFDGTTTQLKPPYTGMTVDTYKPRSVAGMDVNKSASLTVGVAGANSNIFQYSDYGIVARNANMTVLNSKFFNITVGVGGTGMGIWARNGAKLIQTGLGASGAATFDNVQYGVYVTNASFKVKDNAMVNVQGRGVEVSSATVATNDFNNVENNNISTNSYGLYFANNNVKIRVLNNTISNGFDKNVLGIYCSGTSNAGAKTYDVRGNNVTIKSDPTNVNTYGAGILLTNTFSPNAQGNTVQINNYSLSLNPPPGQNNNNGFYPYIYGILETNGKNGTFCSNTITGVYNNQGWGLKTESTTGNKYDCNTFNTIGKALTFLGNCVTLPGTSTNNVVDNDFGSHMQGLYLQANGTNTAQIGKQFHTGNDWTNLGAGNWAAWYENATGQNALDNQFDVNSGDIALGHVTPSTWFQPSSGTDLTCQNPCNTNQINFKVPTEGVTERGPQLIFTDGLYYDVATGQNQLSEYAEAYQWMIKRNIYREITDAYGADYPVEYKDFMDKESAGSVGKFQGFDFDLGKAGQAEAEVEATLNEIEEQIETLEKDNEVWLRDFQAKLGELWQERDQLHKKLKEERLKKSKKLKQQNKGLPAEKDFETYEQQVNDLYLSLEASEQSALSTADSAALDFIAGLCPFEGGFAVYKARALFSWQYGKYKPEWFECEKAIEPRSKESIKESRHEKFAFEVFPNPAGDFFHVRIGNSDMGDCSLRISDASGHLVLQKSMVASTEKIEASGFSPGVYFIEVVNAKGERVFNKVLINK
jgi:Secretion system C-terminal sorting domain